MDFLQRDFVGRLRLKQLLYPHVLGNALLTKVDFSVRILSGPRHRRGKTRFG